VIEELKGAMNQLAYTIVEEVNKAHVQGFDRTGQPASFFFEPVLGKDSPPAMSVKVSHLIRNDLNRIATGIEPNAPGDPTIAHVIAQIQNKNVFEGEASTLDDFYNSQVGKLGVLTQRAVKASEAQAEIVQQLSKLRESISGVSLDEEATKMIEYQKAFDASARLIRTADEMLDTVLNLKRL
jgi:flagellar hook-associated protein 1 FlgK